VQLGRFIEWKEMHKEAGSKETSAFDWHYIRETSEYQNVTFRIQHTP
jgi:hypothetical protein